MSGTSSSQPVNSPSSRGQIAFKLAFPKRKLRAFMDCRPSNVERDRLKSAMGKGYFQLFTEGRRHELEGLAHEKKDGRHCPAALRSFEEVCVSRHGLRPSSRRSLT